MAPRSSNQQNSESSNRLDRIELKIDKLAETVVQMARAEEKLVALENDKQTLLSRMISLEERTLANEKKVSETEANLLVINRVFWITISCLITTTIGIVFVK